MGTANRESSRGQGRGRSVAAPALLAAALLAAAVALVVWSMSSARTVGRLEHEEVSAFSRIRVRRDGDVRALTFVRDNGQEVVQSRVNLTAPHTLMSPYARGMFASYLYQPHPRRVLIVGLGGGAMVRFLTHHEPQVHIDAVEIDPAVVRLADEYFGVRSGGNVRVHTADAVAFVESTMDRYDLIFMDAFLRPASDTDTTGGADASQDAGVSRPPEAGAGPRRRRRVQCQRARQHGRRYRRGRDRVRPRRGLPLPSR